MKVRYLVIEGPDGVGKSTIIKKLVSYFNTSTSYDAKVFNPCNNKYGLAIKDLLKQHKGIIPPVVEANLHITTLQNTLIEIDEYVSTWLEENKDKKKLGKEPNLIIIIDRWEPSTRAYQIEEHGLDPSILDTVNRVPVTYPNMLTIYLDANDEVLNRRLYNRNDDELELYENYELQKRIRERYRQFSKYIGNHKTVDVSSDNVDENVKNVIKELILYL